ncbi:hypothetical protein HD806DRAFT_478092 [Xylariaceae sp. AK1471]|nr:hypothetical protein HD806DRAFT_478092 [Xylariaceae sp. AK1471]
MTSSIPLSVFPPGYVDESLVPRTFAVAVTFIVLEIGIVTLRFATRYLYNTKLGIDDYLIIPALIFTLGVCVITIVELKIAGVGRHLDVLYVTKPQAVVNWAKSGYAIETLYGAGVAFPKLSVLFIYLRIFTGRIYRAITYALIGIISATGAAVIITSLASCRPFSARWDPALFPTHCIDAPRFWQGASIPNVVTDVVMLVLPIPVVWHLHIDKKQKLALTGIFLLGSVGLVASIIRLTVTYRVTALSDGTWDSADIAMWSLVETGVYLIAACLPVLRPLYLSVIKSVSSIARTVLTTKSHSTSSQSRVTDSKGDDDQRGLVYIQMDLRQDVTVARDGMNHKGGNSLEERENEPATFRSVGNTRWNTYGSSKLDIP